jgi:hypothetical protein
MSKRESCRRGGRSHHGFGGWQRGDGEEQLTVVMKLGIGALGARRGESGGRHRCGEALGCSRHPFISRGGDVRGGGRQDGGGRLQW